MPSRYGDRYLHASICLFFASLDWVWVVNMYLSLWLIYSSKIILGIKYKIREIKNNINFQHINQWWVSIFIKKQTNNLYIESIFFFQDLISFPFLIIFNSYISFNFFNLNDKFRFSKTRTCYAVRLVLAKSLIVSK
jgi:hypothetical protein